jgi:GlpG protein
MRLIGHLGTDKEARTFGDFLYVKGIETEFERDESRWAVWVRSDDQVAEAAQLLAEFRANPNDARFQAGSPAEKMREQEKAQDDAYRKRVVEGKQLFPGLAGYGFGFVTYALIIVCVIVFFISHMGEDRARIASLFISETRQNLPEVRGGEVWRLVTPIFIHFGIVHILFNMMWLRDLGSMFEAKLGSWYFLLFIVLTGVISNYAQWAYTHSPRFGGMSGVNYALVGYVWIRGRFDPAAGLHLDRQSLMFALIWFAVCFTGWVGPIANAAHAGGLLFGMAWAFLDSKRR